LYIVILFPIIYSYLIQHYPPGTQKNNNGFALRNIIMEKGNGLEFHEVPGGLESAKRILMKGSGIREADYDDRGRVPLI